MLVLSEQSIASDWVEGEVEAALERERRDKRTVLFPIRLDDIVMETPIAGRLISGRHGTSETSGRGRTTPNIKLRSRGC
jgi:hypothetical protein